MHSIINTPIQLIRFLYLGLRKRNNWKIDNIEPAYFYIEAAPMTNIVLHYRIVNTIRSNRLQTLRVINDCVTWFVGLHINICIWMIRCLVRKNKQSSCENTWTEKPGENDFEAITYWKPNRRWSVLELADLHRPPYLSFDNFRTAPDVRLVLFRVATEGYEHLRRKTKPPTWNGKRYQARNVLQELHHPFLHPLSSFFSQIMKFNRFIINIINI